MLQSSKGRQRLSLVLLQFIFTATFCLLTFFIQNCNGHGRLIEPPSRASAWRYGFPTPPDYNDNQLYCGGFDRQWNKNDGKCGVCGDPWDSPEPRPHEYGGKWGQGIIVRKYQPETNIILRVELTASHMGYFEFRLCPNVSPNQECLDRHVLNIIGGAPISVKESDSKTRFYPRNGSRIYEIKASLPKDFKCAHCVLQWRYVAGNNWGPCENGTSAVGCGPQEEFRACADILIGDTGRTTIKPFRPATKLPPTTKVPEIPTDETESPVLPRGEPQLDLSPYLALLIIFLTLLVVICLLVLIYLYHYHGQRVKQIMRWKYNKNLTASTVAAGNLTDSPQDKIDSNPMLSSIDSNSPPPVPPPRTKKVSQVKEISSDEPSIMKGDSPFLAR